MTFEEILATTKYTTEETVDQLLPLFKSTGEYNKLQERYLKEINKLIEKYPNISDLNVAIDIMKKELMDYIRKIVLTIKNDFPNLIPNEN